MSPRKVSIGFVPVRWIESREHPESLTNDLYFLVQSNNYRNQKFDLILFDEEDKDGFSCYAEAVKQLNWSRDCKFSEKTRVYKSVDTFSDWLDGLDQIDELSGTIVIDNTPLPTDGSFS